MGGLPSDLLPKVLPHIEVADCPGAIFRIVQMCKYAGNDRLFDATGSPPLVENRGTWRGRRAAGELGGTKERLWDLRFVFCLHGSWPDGPWRGWSEAPPSLGGCSWPDHRPPKPQGRRRPLPRRRVIPAGWLGCNRGLIPVCRSAEPGSRPA